MQHNFAARQSQLQMTGCILNLLIMVKQLILRAFLNLHGTHDGLIYVENDGITFNRTGSYERYELHYDGQFSKVTIV